MNRMRTNNYIKKILNNALGNDEIALNKRQINWKTENTHQILGIVSQKHFFSQIKDMYLIKRDNGMFTLFCPQSKKDKYPCYLYDIMDIESFISRYPVIVMEMQNEMIEEEMKTLLHGLRNGKAIGFIETRENEDTYIYELY